MIDERRTGVIVSKRRLSRKLVFFDVEEEANSNKGIELVIKAGDVFTEEQVHSLRDTLKLGDVVEAAGQLEHAGSHILHLKSIVVLQRWRDTNPNQHFIPRCLSLGSEAVAFAHVPVHEQAAEEHGELASVCQDGHGELSTAGDNAEGFSPSQQHSQGQVKGTGSAATQLCKFHINGRCLKGTDCPFLHVDVRAAPRVRQAWIADRRQHRQRMAAEAGDPHAGGAQRKRQRAAIFADWLLATFGRDALNQGSGVLDIAGGSGSLSFCLQAVHGVRCTTVDPRPAKLSKDAHRHLARLRAEAVQAAFQEASGSCQPLLDSACDSLWGCLDPADAPEDAGSAASDGDSEHSTGPGTRSTEGEALLEGTIPEHIEAEFNEELWDSEHAAWLQSASLVIGLHPDQATDSIVEFAVKHGKPFAVVPCCVFPRLFKHRRLKDGLPVNEHAELVQYLRNMGGQCCQVDYLTFEGMNQVVFRVQDC